MLKIIIPDNVLFDEIIPAIIRGDPLLETALGKRELHVGEVRDIIFQQLIPRLATLWSPVMRMSTEPASTSAGTGTEATLGGRTTMAQPETITRRTLIPASGIPSDSVVRIDGVRPSATTAGNETRTSVASIMTDTVMYTPAAHGNRRGGTARVGAGVNMGHRQVTPNQVPCQENEGSVSSSGGGQERMGTSRLNREARVNICQIIMTLTMLLSDPRHVDGFQAYNCKWVRGTVKAYSLTPLDGCWTEQIRHPPPRHQMGRIF
jgi:hypothetical protein